MRKSASFLAALVIAGVAFVGVTCLRGADKTVTLPKGTKIEKAGPGQFRFILPDGRKAEVKSFDPRSGILGDCGIYDKGKLILKGTRGSLIGVIDPDPPMIIRAGKGRTYVIMRGELLNLQNLSKVPPSDYVLIDDEVTWLPATIQFKTKAAGKTELSPQPDPPGMKTVKLPKGTTGQKLGAGHIRFSLPNAQTVEIQGFNAKTGILGDCGVYAGGKLVAKGNGGKLIGIIEPDPPSIIRASKGKCFALVGSELINLQTMSKVPRSDYVMIDDEVTWLPATIKFN